MYLYSVSTQQQDAVSFMKVDIGNFGFAGRLGQFLGPFFVFTLTKCYFSVLVPSGVCLKLL